MIPLGLEPDESQILRRKPQPKDAPILPTSMVIRMIIIAVLMSGMTLGTYFIAKLVLGSAEQANTLAFTALVVMQWSSAISARGLYESAWQRLKVRHHGFWWALLVAVLLQISAIFGPLAVLAGTVATPLIAIIVTALVAFVVPLVVIELYKKFQRQE